MIAKYCSGPAAYIAALAVVLLVHACAVECDQAAERITTKAVSGRNA